MTGGHPMGTIDIECRNCRTNYQIVAPVAAIHAWLQGEYIKDALPMLSIDERELLISQTCNNCWEEMFSDF